MADPRSGLGRKPLEQSRKSLFGSVDEVLLINIIGEREERVGVSHKGTQRSHGAFASGQMRDLEPLEFVASVPFSKMPSGGKRAHEVPNPNRSQFTDHTHRKCKPTDNQRGAIFNTRRGCYSSNLNLESKGGPPFV
ncbi:hypothetical protein SDJN02_14891, partial [Cucurbita argyrosperma subsp. argyrosperma]